MPFPAKSPTDVTGKAANRFPVTQGHHKVAGDYPLAVKQHPAGLRPARSCRIICRP